MRKLLLSLPLLAALVLMLPGCGQHDKNAYDEDFIPYNIIAFDVYVYNTKTDKEYYVGSIETNYFNAQEDLSDAQSMAYDFAESRHLKNWDYICYTVTDSSDCVTSVK